MLAPTARPCREQIACGTISEDDDTDGGDHHGHQPRAGNVVQQDGKRGVDQDIAQQEGAQQVVALTPHRLDALGVVLLFVRATVLHDAQLHGVQGHQAQVEATEHAREAQEE